MNSLITADMIVLWGRHFGALSIDDVPGIVGSLEAFVKGEGQLPAELFDAEATREVFAPVRSAYFKALGQEEPGFSNVEKKEE